MQGRLGKIVLVVLGVILMLMFILPAGIQNTASRSVAMGTIDGEDVSPDDVGRARRKGALVAGA